MQEGGLSRAFETFDTEKRTVTRENATMSEFDQFYVSYFISRKKKSLQVKRRLKMTEATTVFDAKADVWSILNW